MSDELERLQRWFAAQCDGDWEHHRGVSIETLDNPGWCVRVDLRGTDAESIEFVSVAREASEDDWIRASVSAGTLEGHCGPLNLVELLRVFVEAIDPRA